MPNQSWPFFPRSFKKGSATRDLRHRISSSCFHNSRANLAGSVVSAVVALEHSRDVLKSCSRVEQVAFKSTSNFLMSVRASLFFVCGALLQAASK
jgi:hypothetical protein